uniref:Conserved plasma membrane protein n=1 Tax=Macrostomum lignano TaxID=282301 RepID=A0A1I8HCL6_9PLAT
ARGETLLFTQQQQQQQQQQRSIGTQESTGVRGRTDLNGGSSSGGGDAIRQPLLLTEASEQPTAAASLANKMTASASSSNGGGGGDKSKRKQIMTRARKHPTVDRIITVLQDKRFEDDQADQIQDLQLPMLRKVLNVIFIALGVVFLLGVIVVIIYTSLASARAREE